MSVSLKIMSYNVRTSGAPDGINVFANRKERLVEIIEKESPDIIGLQELTDESRDYLRSRLPGYTFFGSGRNADYHGEHSEICVLNRGMEVIEMRNHFLSFTPNVPGNTFGGDQSPCPRMYTILKIKHDRSDRLFSFANTHLDHVGNRAKLFGTMQILQDLNNQKLPFILTGDFNALPKDDVVSLVLHMPGKKVQDCTRMLGTTYHGYGIHPYCNRLQEGETSPDKIDYIFTDLSWDESESRVVEDVPVNGVYASDHYAVVTRIHLPD